MTRLKSRKNYSTFQKTKNKTSNIINGMAMPYAVHSQQTAAYYHYEQPKRSKIKPPRKEDESMTARNATINSPPVEYVVFKTQEKRSTSKGNSVIHTISIGALLILVICWELRGMDRVDFVLTGMKLLGVALLCMLTMIPIQSKSISPVSRKMKLLVIYSCSWVIFLDFGWEFWISRVKPKMSNYPHDDTCTSLEKKAQGPEEIMLQSRFENAMGDYLLLDDAPFRDILSLLPKNNIGDIANCKSDATLPFAETPLNRLELSMDTGLHEDTSVKKATTQSQETIHKWRLHNWIIGIVLNVASAAEIQVSKALRISDGIANEEDGNDIPSLKIQASCSEPRTDNMFNPRSGSFPDHNVVPSSTLPMRMSELLRLIELHYIAGDNSMIFIPITVSVVFYVGN
jgi:uncharacterized membrane protein (Fun14 family)